MFVYHSFPSIIITLINPSISSEVFNHLHLLLLRKRRRKREKPFSYEDGMGGYAWQSPNLWEGNMPLSIVTD